MSNSEQFLSGPAGSYRNEGPAGAGVAVGGMGAAGAPGRQLSRTAERSLLICSWNCQMVNPMKNLCLYSDRSLVAQAASDVLVAKLIKAVPTSSWYERVSNPLSGQHER